MTIAKPLFLILGLLTLVVSFDSCTSDEDVTDYINDHITDSTGVIEWHDYYLSGKMDGEDFQYFNAQEGITNQPLTYENGFCDSVNGYLGYIQVQTTVFHNPTQRENSFYIEIVDCIGSGPDYEDNLDDMLRTRQLPILNLADSAVGAQIQYYDDLGEHWSTAYGDNSDLGNKFQISATVENTADTASTDVVFGAFSCLLFNMDGDSIKLRNCTFKGRIGKRN